MVGKLITVLQPNQDTNAEDARSSGGETSRRDVERVVIVSPPPVRVRLGSARLLRQPANSRRGRTLRLCDDHLLRSELLAVTNTPGEAPPHPYTRVADSDEFSHKHKKKTSTNVQETLLSYQPVS